MIRILRLPIAIVLLIPGLVVRASAADPVPSAPPPASEDAPPPLTADQEEVLLTIVRDVTRGVLEAEGEPIDIAQHRDLVERVARGLATDLSVVQNALDRRRQERGRRKDLITSIVLNVAKGIAVVIALLVLRAIVGAIGAGVAAENKGGPVGVFVNTDSEGQAEEIGRALVGEALASSASITPQVRSFSRHEDGARETSGALLVLRAVTEELSAVIARVEQLHPKDVPEIIALPIRRSHDS